MMGETIKHSKLPKKKDKIAISSLATFAEKQQPQILLSFYFLFGLTSYKDKLTITARVHTIHNIHLIT